MSRPRVLLADDHRIISEGLKGLLSDDFELVGAVEDGRALVAAAKAIKPGVIVADITMPHMHGIDAVAQLRHDNRDVKVLSDDASGFGLCASRAGRGRSRFCDKALRHCRAGHGHSRRSQGQTFTTPALTKDVLRKAGKSSDPAKAANFLTARQREILRLLAEGKSAKEIALSLSISPRTVEFHKYRLMETHGLHSDAELIYFAIKHGLVTI
jgi:DNA-binding NarL/FixJ family response regulator